MIFLAFLFGFLLQFAVSTRVQLSTGTIEGKHLNATYSPFGNQSAIVFFGIPHVQPPVGDLRFRKPQLPLPWDGVLETKKYKPACMSEPKKTYKNKVGGPISEDCLYANVFTNQYCMENKNCSVMIVIHGGGLLFESAAAFHPEILINNFVGHGRNIVVVTINYRLGVFGFGFLNGGDEDQNVALYDVMEGVKWVRREIHNFGGNKNRITLVGHSAGGQLVTVFAISPLTKGLIHQQIVMSPPIPEYSKMSNLKATRKLARNLGCLSKKVGFDKLSQRQINNTLSCLRQVSAQELWEAQRYVLFNTTYYFGAPHVDGEFITDYLDHLSADKSIYPINTLIGTTTAELRESQYLIDPKNDDQKDELVTNLCEHIAYELYEEPERLVENCQNYYKNGSNAQYLGDDIQFYTKVIQLANAHKTKNTKVFLYSYAYTGAGAAYDNYQKVPSPHHSEDLIYVFGTHRAVFTPKDYIIEHIYSGMFANFINFEDPSPSQNQQWIQYTPEKREHFLIDFDQNFTMPGMKDNYYSDALQFWSSVGDKSFKEHWSPSIDFFQIKHMIAATLSHKRRVSIDFDKSWEQMDKLYIEQKQFLQQLKLERKLEIKGRVRKIAMKYGDVPFEMEKEGGGFNILLIIFAGILLGGVLCVTISHFCLHHKSRQGYELLK